MKERPFQPWSIVKAVIVVRFTQRNHLDEERDYEKVIGSMSDLDNFFRWEPDKAMMLGHTARDEDVLKSSMNSNLRLSIRYGLTVDMDKEEPFTDVHDMYAFLDANNYIAKALQYVALPPRSKSS